MRVAVNSHALPIYKKNRIASLLCIFETTIRVHVKILEIMPVGILPPNALRRDFNGKCIE